MPDYLLKKDWKTILDNKAHSKVKKTGISDVLDDYASAKKKDDLGLMVSTLEKIAEKAKEVKTAQKAYPLMTGYLDKMITAAKTEEGKLAPRLAKLSEDAKEDGGSGELAKALKTVKILAKDKAWHFVIVPGKPSSGLVLSKTGIKPDHMKKAYEMKGSRGPFFTGLCYGEKGKYAFEMEAQPPKGLATSIKKAALLHAELAIKLLVRGGGVELDSDTDLDQSDEESGLGNKPVDTQLSTEQAHEQRIAQLKSLVEKMEGQSGGTRDGAMDGVIAGAGRMRTQIENDGTLGDVQKTTLLGKLDDVVKAARKVTDSGTPSPLAKYPSVEDWMNLATQIDKLDPSKHDAGWKRYMLRYDQVFDQFGKDTALSVEDQKTVKGILEKALARAETVLKRAERLQGSSDNLDDPALTKRFLALETKVETIERANLPENVTDKALTDFRDLRLDFRGKRYTNVKANIAKTERLVNALHGTALTAIRVTTSRQDQQEMHSNLAPSMGLIKKAAFSPGMIKDPTTMREAMKQNPSLVKLVKAGSEVTKKVDDTTVRELENAAHEVLEGIKRRKPEPPRKLQYGDEGFDEMNDQPQFAPPVVKDEQPLQGDAESEKMAIEVLKRANMARMVMQYETLGPPPWDEEKTDLASELQAQLFFVESAIATGEPNYRAPSSKDGGKDEGGASGSWWIERAETNRRTGTKGKKTYIFKPGSREAPVFAGLPPGSGAPREVMAKKLDDIMAGAGFEIGVSPTTLANLDGSQLGGDMDPGAGPQLGSMQRLAPSDGSIDDIVEKAMKGGKPVPIEKGSFDNVAVFDMIFANLDRHGGNLLVVTDEATGAGKLLPIDHGSALPDPDALQLNRAALLPPENAMADPRKLPQCLEPLGDDALESLGRLDPDAMVRDMKKQRDDMLQRHPGTTGMISDAAIDAMAARVRFIKQVGGTVPVAQLFEMLAYGADRIAKCPANGIAQLAQTLLAETNARAEGKKSTKVVTDLYNGLGTSNIAADFDNDLKSLGWAWSIPQSGVLKWAQDNSDLAARIFKTRMVNPAALREIQRLLPLAKQVSKTVDADIAKKNIGEQVKYLFDLANSDLFKRLSQNNTTLDSVLQQYNTLGGDAALARVVKVLPATQSDLPKPADDASDDKKFEYYAPLVKALQQFAEFERLGGTAEIVRLGGEVPRNVPVGDVLRDLMALQKDAPEIADLMSKSDNEIDQGITTAYGRLGNDIDAIMQRLVNAAFKIDAAKWKTDGVNAWQNGDKEEGVARLSRAARMMATQEAAQTDWINKNTINLQDLRDALANEENKVKLDFEQDRARLDRDMTDALLVFDSIKFGLASREWDQMLKVAKEGDESEFRKTTALLNQLEQRVAGHRGWPWHQGVKAGTDAIRSKVVTFDLRWMTDPIKFANLRLDVADKLVAIMGNVQVTDLSNDLQQKIAYWSKQIEDNTSLEKIDPFLKELAEGMPQNAI